MTIANKTLFKSDEVLTFGKLPREFPQQSEHALIEYGFGVITLGHGRDSSTANQLQKLGQGQPIVGMQIELRESHHHCATFQSPVLVRPIG